MGDPTGFLRTPRETARGRPVLLRLRDEVLDLAERLARILAGVHEAGVVHHDLHPWNVLLTKDGDVEPINFDRATTIAAVRPGFTHHREILGRLPYCGLIRIDLRSRRY
jgi:RIO-like serine/threonine protein kinase